MLHSINKGENTLTQNETLQFISTTVQINQLFGTNSSASSKLYFGLPLAFSAFKIDLLRSYPTSV